MAGDLDDLLLLAAGRKKSGGGSRSRHPHSSSKRRREKSYSDDGSDSKDDGSDDNRGYASRKPSVSHVPLKKRSKDIDDDDYEYGSQEDEDGNSDHRGGDSGGEESDVGSDLYKDEDDRQKLAQLSELEREMILSDRATKIDDKKLQEKVRSRWKTDQKKPQQSKRETTPPILASSSRSVRSSTRSADRTSHKYDALRELQAKRMKQRGFEASRSGFSSRGFSDVKSSESDSDSEEHSDDGRRGAGRIDDDSDDDKQTSNIPTFEDIKSITIKRRKLAKWFMEPFFEDLIVGCFVRVGIGVKSGQNIYRLCIVRNVDASDPDRQYKLENKMTYKYLNCIWGSESSAARWQMGRISDQAPLEEEYRQWMREVERSGARMLLKDEVEEKQKAIEKINNYVYSAETVKQMLQEKKSAATRPLNIAAEKEKLRRELELAQYKNNEHEVERIQGRLQELDAARQAQDKDSKALRLAEMNRKNRVENFRNASESKRVNNSLKAGEAGYDPFSRRWTRSTNYYAAKPEGGNQALFVENGGGDKNPVENGNVEEIIGSEGGGNGKSGGLKATQAALEAAAEAGKLVDTRAPLEQGTELYALHNFDIPISLAALQRFGGAQGGVAGYMANKQRVEAAIGYKVPENDGRMHALTLTVSDYKRRRGLL